MKFIILQFILILVSISLINTQSCSCDEGHYMNTQQNKCLKNPKSGEQNYQELCNNHYTYDSQKKLPVCRVCKPEASMTQNNICALHNIPNCLQATFDFDANKFNCTNCSRNYFVNSYAVEKDQQCKPFPTNGQEYYTWGCTEYLQEYGRVTCRGCATGLFFYGPEYSCKSPDTYIDHCNKYSDDVRCSKCDYGYNLASGNTKCLKSEPVSEGDRLEGCTEHKNTGSGYDCKQCRGHYYLDNGDKRCKSVGKTIEHCIEYDSDGNCSLCQEPLYSVKSSGDVCLQCPERAEKISGGGSPTDPTNPTNPNGKVSGDQVLSLNLIILSILVIYIM